ncbi:MAG: nucleoside-diphosphate-sugar epimerase [Rhodobacteraceae bacterium HLUCCA08]|nr:MAG: nucleoside-diphosphate-sugar epimerase [Rhodobacteraceae bacterium HLUCCA08]
MEAKRVLLLGGTGTIGRATAKALIGAGHSVTAITRASSDALAGCDQRIGPVTDPAFLNQVVGLGVDAIVSCLASRTGTPQDAWAIDHDANLAALRAAQDARVPQFILLSAICVQKPLLEFQRAKLAFEAALQSSGLTFSIIRPTAFFKSLSGQIGRLRAGKPFLVFGDGRLTACKPISDADLARFLTLCLTDADKRNRILPIGGPGPALTPLDQGRLLADALGVDLKVRHVPPALLSGIATGLDLVGRIVPALGTKAALARIGHYYATESMLLWDGHRYNARATPSFGTDTLAGHYAAAARGDTADDRGAHAVF